MSLAPFPALPLTSPLPLTAAQPATARSAAAQPATARSAAAQPATVRSAAARPVEPPAVPWPWQAAAACGGLPPDVVFAKRAKVAAPALRACAACPVRRECEEAVAPAESWFDGVCGGRLWRGGRPAALTSPSGSPRA
ncbi:WhiB family transcriptional regulator [Streptomyces sp. NPDC048357]|uniref:WhiB family transcriptional regulator n=1 Tax=Streptomyces sp. NPDC048357 TaxID=3154719 RepID=UPI0034305F61